MWPRPSTPPIIALTLCLLSAGACRDAVAPPLAPVTSNTPASAESLSVDATYTVVNLGTLPGGGNSYGEAINVTGDVAGISTDSAGMQHAVLWIGTTPTDLGIPFGTQSAAFGINDSRAVAGYSTDGVTKYGVLWKGGSHTLIAGVTGPQNASARAVNNSDVVTGYHLVGGTNFHAFRFSASGGLVDIHPSGYSHSVGLGINDAGVIVGYVQLSNGDTHAARWTSTNAFTDLGTLGGTVGQAEAVNTAGTIVGESEETSGRISPFTWRAATGMVGTGLGGYALDISDAGRVVGYKPLTNRSVAATGKNVMSILTLPSLQGGTNSYAVGVNTCGHIAGIADVAGGAYRAVRWSIQVCD